MPESEIASCQEIPTLNVRVKCTNPSRQIIDKTTKEAPTYSCFRGIFKMLLFVRRIIDS